LSVGSRLIFGLSSDPRTRRRGADVNDAVNLLRPPTLCHLHIDGSSSPILVVLHHGALGGLNETPAGPLATGHPVIDPRAVAWPSASNSFSADWQYNPPKNTPRRRSPPASPPNSMFRPSLVPIPRSRSIPRPSFANPNDGPLLVRDLSKPYDTLAQLENLRQVQAVSLAMFRPASAGPPGESHLRPPSARVLPAEHCPAALEDTALDPAASRARATFLTLPKPPLRSSRAYPRP
jgi:hypothetical protein